MRKYVALSISVLFFVFITASLLSMIEYQGYEEDRYHYINPLNGNKTEESVPEHYIKETKNETGAINAVTAVVVEYRGFDTLGEVTVLFTATTGISFLLYTFYGKKKRREANLIAKEGAKIVLPFALLTGAYIFIHGHLTPGGGFPGGSVVASGFILMMLVYPEFFIREKNLSWSESMAGSIFVIIGLLGIVFATAFLQNFIPLGKVGLLFSAGIIPIIYIAIGFKVGSELGSIVQNMKEVQK